MITLYTPKDQAKTRHTCVTHLHKDLKQILIDSAVPSESTGLYPQSPQTVVRESTNNKKIGDSSVSSLEEDPSSSAKKETFLETLIKL